MANLSTFVQSQTQPILFVAESPGRREVFDEQLRKSGIQTEIIDHPNAYFAATSHCITVAGLDVGMHWDRCTIITESDVLGTRQSDHKRDASQRIIDPDKIVRNLNELAHRCAGSAC